MKKKPRRSESKVYLLLQQVHLELHHLKELIMSTSAERTQEYRTLIQSLNDSRTEILAAIDAYANAAAGTPEEAEALVDLKTAVKGQADIIADGPATV